jgi:ABC-2 type transport system ATP-binding protein
LSKKTIDYIPDRPYIYLKLTGLENLLFIAGLYSVSQDVVREKAEKFFTFFDLQNFTYELIEAYSLSMRQKLLIAGYSTTLK